MIEDLLALVHGMAPDLADVHLTVLGVDPARRALVQMVLAAIDEPADHGAPDADLEPGDARYTRLRLLSDEGATADVWLAHDRLLDREVAVKCFRAGGRGLAAVVAEARAVARVRSDHVVAVHDVVRLDGHVAIVMERVGDGYEASQTSGAGAPRPVRAVVDQLVCIARGVADAHDRGVFHLDLKPANVLVDARADGTRVKVTDFGLARVAADRRTGDDTFVGMRGEGATRRIVAGTLPWMSPEQANGLPWPIDTQRHASALTAIDVHGLGALAFGLLTGRAPNGPTRADRLEHLAAIARGDRDDIATVARRERRPVPRRLAAIVRRALSFDASARPHSARAFIAALEAWRRGVVRTRVLVAVGLAAATLLIAIAWPSPDDDTHASPTRAASLTHRDAGAATSDRTTATRIVKTIDDTAAPSAIVATTGGATRTRDTTGHLEDVPERDHASGAPALEAAAAATRRGLSVNVVGRDDTRRSELRPVGAAPVLIGIRPSASAFDPPEGSPERVLRDAFTAARDPDAAAGWAALRALLHPDSKLGTDQARDLYFAALRRSVWRLAPDPDVVRFHVDHTRKNGDDEVVLYIGTRDAAMPRPFTLARDHAADEAWRLLRY